MPQLKTIGSGPWDAINPAVLFTNTVLYFHRPLLWRTWQQAQVQQWWSAQKIARWQLEQLKKVVTHAYKNVPFYQQKMNKAGFHPDKLQTLSDLDRIPLSSADELQAAVSEGSAIATSYKNQKLSWLRTTGSTGFPFSFPLDKQAQEVRRAYLFRTIGWYGHRPGLRNARLWRTSQEKTWQERLEQQVFGRRLELTIYDDRNPQDSFLSEEKIGQFCEQLIKYQPLFIDSYASTLWLLADYIERHTITNIRPRAIVSGAEYLSPEARRHIEKAFNCPVFNRYGGTEIGLMAHECGYHPDHKLHVMADRLVAEVVRHHKSVPAGESGEIIMTDFTSYAVPFIRFQVDDVGSLASPDEQCPCGRGLPLLNVIEGRINDLFTLPNGSLVSTHIWQKIFRDYGFIRQFQVIQHTKEHIEVLVSLRFTPDAKQYAELKQRLTEFLPGCTVRWVEKEQLVPGPGGKFRHCISHVPLQFNQPLP